MFRDTEPAPINAPLTDLMTRYELVAALPEMDTTSYALALIGRVPMLGDAPDVTSMRLRESDYGAYTRLNYAFPVQPATYWEAISHIVHLLGGMEDSFPESMPGKLGDPIFTRRRPGFSFERAIHPSMTHIATTRLQHIAEFQINPASDATQYSLHSIWEITHYTDTHVAVNDDRHTADSPVAIGMIDLGHNEWMSVRNGDILRFYLADEYGNLHPWITDPRDIFCQTPHLGRQHQLRVHTMDDVREIRDRFAGGKGVYRSILMNETRLEELAALLSQHI